MQGIDIKKIKEVKSFAQNFWDMDIYSFANGDVTCHSKDEKVAEMLLKVFDAALNETKKRTLTGYAVKALFIGKGISDYNFTIPHLFQLVYGREGIDYELLQNSDYSMEFEFIDLARATMQIYTTSGAKLVHKKGEDPTQPRFVEGNTISYVYNMENVISTTLSATSAWVTSTSIDDTAGLFLNEIECCLLREPEEDVIKALRTKKEAIFKIFKVKSLVEILDIATDEFEVEKDIDLKGVLEKASK